MAKVLVLALVSGALLMLPPSAAFAQRPAEDAATFAAYLATGNQVTPDITYLTASGVDLKLDFYRPRGIRVAPHGGAVSWGWI